ncbi:hypothetical protein Tco_1256348 [Tanacetum coccineum]
MQLTIPSKKIIRLSLSQELLGIIDLMRQKNKRMKQEGLNRQIGILQKMEFDYKLMIGKLQDVYSGDVATRYHQEELYIHKEEKAPMAFSESEVKTCSKSCQKDYEDLKKKYDDLLVKLDDTGFKAYTYKRGLSILEAQVVKYKESEVLFSEEIALLKRSVGHKDYLMGLVKTELEKVKEEKEGFEFKLAKFEKSSKDLDALLASQMVLDLGWNLIIPQYTSFIDLLDLWLEKISTQHQGDKLRLYDEVRARTLFVLSSSNRGRLLGIIDLMRQKNKKNVKQNDLNRQNLGLLQKIMGVLDATKNLMDWEELQEVNALKLIMSLMYTVNISIRKQPVLWSLMIINDWEVTIYFNDN